MAAAYPDAAGPQRLSGEATFRCVVDDQGALHDCVVLSALPAGYGFDKAAQQILPIFRLQPTTSDGAPTAGKTWAAKIRWANPN